MAPVYKTNRGNSKLCEAGFYYIIDKDGPSGKIIWKWERANNTKIKCSISLINVNQKAKTSFEINRRNKSILRER